MENKMILEVRKFPESQEVMDKDDWFPIMTNTPELRLMKNVGIGHSAYARVMEDDEYILTEKTTADEYNKEYAEDIDLQAFAQGRKSSFDNNIEEKTTADEFNVVVDDVGQVYDPTDFISERDPGDENTNRRQRDNDRRKS